MTVVQVQCFLAAVKNGSFSGAAKELYLSTQAVSQHIGRLEQEVGCSLFLRQRDGVSPTVQGWQFHSFAAKWLGLYNRTMRNIQETYGSLPLSFRIGLSEYIDSLGAISGGILDFSRTHSDCTVTGTQYSNRAIMQALAAGEIDVALMPDTQVAAGGDLEVAAFAREDLRLFISGVTGLEPGLKLGDPRLAEVCRGLPHLDTSYGIWSADEWGEISGRMNAYLDLPPHIHYALPNFRSVIACLQMTPCSAVCDVRFGYLRPGGQLYSVPLEVESFLSCVWSRKNENPLAGEFVAHMKWYYGEAQAQGQSADTADGLPALRQSSEGAGI